MTVLVIAAHPDEVLGCGGAIARLAQEGHDVYIAILGEGITSRYDQRDQADQTRVEALHERSQQVTKLLGAKDLFTYDLPGNRFNTVPLLDVTKTVEELIARPFPHPRSPEALRAIARRWGSVVGKEAVEAFEVIRVVR